MDQNQVLVSTYKKALPFIVVVLFCSEIAFAIPGESLVICKRDKSVRTLRVEVTTDSRCRAIYTKQGVDQSIATSQSRKVCAEVVAGVRKTLEDAKWTCREVKDIQASSLNSSTTEL